ncbi:hypothetical protein RHS01_10595 [Rhizoctonia solani]|uniref:Uncharacterized protein n=1 Tax=Rhizoctonia solani TaxID=456999 RepID=A0A8H7I4I6_9AGAM|nr:hypothetical protein RHS01_10595 [Rhizoctonia solani]
MSECKDTKLRAAVTNDPATVETSGLAEVELAPSECLGNGCVITLGGLEMRRLRGASGCSGTGDSESCRCRRASYRVSTCSLQYQTYDPAFHSSDCPWRDPADMAVPPETALEPVEPDAPETALEPDDPVPVPVPLELLDPEPDATLPPCLHCPPLGLEPFLVHTSPNSAGIPGRTVCDSTRRRSAPRDSIDSALITLGAVPALRRRWWFGFGGGGGMSPADPDAGCARETKRDERVLRDGQEGIVLPVRARHDRVVGSKRGRRAVRARDERVVAVGQDRVRPATAAATTTVREDRILDRRPARARTLNVRTRVCARSRAVRARRVAAVGPRVPAGTVPAPRAGNDTGKKRVEMGWPRDESDALVVSKCSEYEPLVSGSEPGGGGARIRTLPLPVCECAYSPSEKLSAYES